MTALDENRMAPRPTVADLPVWQLELPPAAPPASTAESGLDAFPDPDEPSIDEAETTHPEAPRMALRKPPPRGQRVSSVSLLLVASALVAIGGVSFAVGHVTSSGGPGFGSGGSGAGLAAGAGTISGTVVSATADSMTLQLANGQTVTIATGTGTSYYGQTSATSGAVTAGSTVIVQTSGTGTGSATGSASATASASPGTGGVRTATSVTITGS
ncbi:MAG: hypothetical protein ABSG37_10045 [Candidatus Limnocylindrales bacterium]